MSAFLLFLNCCPRKILNRRIKAMPFLQRLLIAVESPIRYIFGRDIFISYSRADAGNYAPSLVLALQSKKPKLSVYLDKWVAPPSGDLPNSLKRHLRWSSILVLICTENSVKSEFVKKEINSFSRLGRKVIPVDVNKSFLEFKKDKDIWKQIGGASTEDENNDAVNSGVPSDNVVERILKSIDFTEQDRRLQRAVWGTLAFITVIIASAALISLFTIRQANATAAEAIGKEQAALSNAAAAEEKAGKAETREKEANKKVTQLVFKAIAAENKASEEERKAAEASARAQKADQLRETAEKATAKAEQLRDAAQKDAYKNREIAASNRLVNQSQLAFRQQPDNPAQSLVPALESVQRAVSVGHYSVEADMALRESLALMPRFHGSRKFENFAGKIVASAISPDAKHIATLRSDENSNTKFLQICPSEVADLLREIKCINRQVVTSKITFGLEKPIIALSNDTRYAAVAEWDDIKLYDLTKDVTPKSIVNSQNFHPSGVSPKIIALTPNAKYLIFVADDGENLDVAYLWDIEEQKLKSKELNPATSESNTFSITDVVFSPDGESLVFGGKILNGGSNIGLKRAIDFEGPPVIWNIDFSELLKLGFERRAIDLPRLEQIRAATTLVEQIDAVAYHPVSRRVATARENVATVWEPVGKTYKPIARMRLENLIERLAFDSTGNKLSIVRNPSKKTSNERNAPTTNLTVEIWDAKGLRESAQCPHVSNIKKISFGFGGNIFLLMNAQGGNWTFIKRVDNCEDIGHEFFGSQYQGANYASADFAFVADTRENPLRIWKVPNKIPIDFPKSDLNFRSISLTPDGKTLALAANALEEDLNFESYVVIYELDNKGYKEKRTLSGKDEVSEISLSPDGKHLVMLSGSTVKIIFIRDGKDETPKSIRELKNITAFKLSPQGQYLVTRSSGSARKTTSENKWEGGNDTQILEVRKLSDGALVKSCEQSREIVEQSGEINGVEFSVDDQFLVMGCAGEIAQFVSLSRFGITTLSNDFPIASVAFSPDGRYFGVGTRKGVLRVYETTIATEVARLQHEAAVTNIAFNQDSRYVATTSNNELKVWLLRPEDLIKEAVERLRLLPNNSTKPSS